MGALGVWLPVKDIWILVYNKKTGRKEVRAKLV
jgi:hypothetical protein